MGSSNAPTVAATEARSFLTRDTRLLMLSTTGNVLHVPLGDQSRESFGLELAALKATLLTSSRCVRVPHKRLSPTRLGHPEAHDPK